MVSSRAKNLWTSALERTKITASGVPCTTRVVPSLNEISAGTCDGMTYEDVKRDMPSEYKARSKDKLRYRYPQGTYTQSFQASHLSLRILDVCPVFPCADV